MIQPQLTTQQHFSDLATRHGSAYANVIQLQCIVLECARKAATTLPPGDAESWAMAQCIASARLLSQLTGFTSGLIEAEALRIITNAQKAS